MAKVWSWIYEYTNISMYGNWVSFRMTYCSKTLKQNTHKRIHAWHNRTNSWESVANNAGVHGGAGAGGWQQRQHHLQQGWRHPSPGVHHHHHSSLNNHNNNTEFAGQQPDHVAERPFSLQRPAQQHLLPACTSPLAGRPAADGHG